MNRQDFEKLKLPETPGVYFWQDSKGKILYIGKATNLRDRVRSYFSPDIIKTRGAHIVDMVFKAKNIKYQETMNVLEALIVEANLIKKYSPYYNTKEKDDKSFNCVAITREEFPRILLVREKDIDAKNKLINNPRLGLKNQKFDTVFGPYPSGSSIREALKIIRKIFPYRDTASSQKDKAVFYRQINLSPDLRSDQAIKEYKKTINRIKLVFQGKLKKLIYDIQKDMMSFAKKENFEEADYLKQKIFALTHIQDISLLKRDIVHHHTGDLFRIEAYDVAHLSGTNMVGVMVVIENAKSNKNEYRKFNIKGFTKANDAGALREILVRRFTHNEWKFPNLIVVDGNTIQSNVANEVLKKLELNIPVIAVTKDDRHRPKSITGDKKIINLRKYEILLANSESHRFALSFHKAKRKKAML